MGELLKISFARETGMEHPLRVFARGAVAKFRAKSRMPKPSLWATPKDRQSGGLQSETSPPLLTDHERMNGLGVNSRMHRLLKGKK